MTRPSDEWIGHLYDRYGAALYRYAVMVLADATAAADVVQIVFTALLRRPSAPEFDERYLRRAVDAFNSAWIGRFNREWPASRRTVGL